MRLWEIKPRKGFMILLPGNMKMYFKDLVKENSFEGKKMKIITQISNQFLIRKMHNKKKEPMCS